MNTMEICEAYYDRVFKLIYSDSDDDDANYSNTVYEAIHWTVNACIVPAISVFGILGNLVNLLVLTHKQLQCSMKSMERSYTSILVALAFSDLCFCLLYFMLTPGLLGDARAVIYIAPRQSMAYLYYSTYKGALINVFYVNSTWLTVVVAVGRYVAICWPLHARSLIGLKGTRTTILLVLLGSVLVNVPRFFHYSVVSKPCSQLLKHSPQIYDYENDSNMSYSVYNSTAAEIDAPQDMQRNFKRSNRAGTLFSNDGYELSRDVSVTARYSGYDTLDKADFGSVKSYLMSKVMLEGDGRPVDDADTDVNGYVNANDEERVGTFTQIPINSLIYVESYLNLSQLDNKCSCLYAFKSSGELYAQRRVITVYNIAYAVLAIFLPLLVLFVCNVLLVKALRESMRLQQKHRTMTTQKNGSGKMKHHPGDDGYITPTLIALIVMYIVLVCPSELLGFFQDHVFMLNSSADRYHVFESAKEIVNCLLILNFAISVVLYCIINTRFRRVVGNLIKCRKANGSKGFEVCSKMTLNTTLNEFRISNKSKRSIEDEFEPRLLKENVQVK